MDDVDFIVADPGVDTVTLKENGAFPNHPVWPLVVYRRVIKSVNADRIRSLLNQNGWGGSWVNGIFSYHHYHSNNHELLAVLSGQAKVQFGGPGGPAVRIETGDAVILPAGTAHKKLDASADFSVLGAYPGWAEYDMCYGNEEERPAADERIAAVPKPGKDPFFGSGGLLISLWR